MVALVFNAEAVPTEATIHITFGRSHSEIRWADKRELTFHELAKLLSQSSVGTKNGSCFTPATFSGFARRKDQASRIDIAALDADCGHTLDEIKSSVASRGWRSIIHSTYSHLTCHTTIAADPCDRWIQDNPGSSIEGYMLAKRGYLPRVVKGATIEEEAVEAGARCYYVRHNPCPKFRVILPLQESWIASSYATQALANASWKERIGALAHALNLYHDQSCVDTSRLFYLPRHRAEQEFVFAVTDGQDCPIWALPDAEVEKPPSLFNVRPKPSLVRPEHVTFRGKSGEQIDLTTWAAKYASRFEIVTALRAKAPHLIASRRSGVKQHIVCPHSADHVTGQNDRTGTYAVNASDLPHAQLPEISSGFVIHCMHNGCSGHDRLSHLRALLGSEALIISDLTNPAFLAPELPPVDISGILSPAKVKGNQAPTNDGNIAPGLYDNLPGVMRDMHEYMCATSTKPQPALNLGALLAFMASAIGRKVKLQHWGVRPNVYVLGVAYAGAGKERSLSAIKNMAQSAGLIDKLVGVEDVASDAGIIASVMQCPSQVMLLDEVGFLISAANNPRAGVHIVNVVGTLLKLYSSSHTKFKGKSYADSDKWRSVDQPCVSLYGCSTPSTLFSALSSKDVSSGLLSRMMLFDAGERDQKSHPPKEMNVPASVIDWLRAWDRVSPVSNPMHRDGGEQVLEPITVLMTDDAMGECDSFEDEMHAAKIEARKRGTDAVYVRALENALKFALIRGCAPIAVQSFGCEPRIDRSGLHVDAETMRWGIDLSRSTVTAMEKSVRDEMADTVFDAKVRDLRKAIQKAGPNGLTDREINRVKAGRLPKKERDDVMQVLFNGGEVSYVKNVNEGKFCRPRSAYVHRDFIESGSDKEEDG